MRPLRTGRRLYKTFKVPVFFGPVHAGYGHLWRWTRGLTVSQEAGVKTEVYVAKSMYADFNPNSVEGLLKVAECPQKEGYIKRVSTNGLCMMPTEVGGSASTYYADYFRTNGASRTGLRVRAAGGSANYGTNAGAFATNASARGYECDCELLVAPLRFRGRPGNRLKRGRREAQNENEKAGSRRKRTTGRGSRGAGKRAKRVH